MFDNLVKVMANLKNAGIKARIIDASMQLDENNELVIANDTIKILITDIPMNVATKISEDVGISKTKYALLTDAIYFYVVLDCETNKIKNLIASGNDLAVVLRINDKKLSLMKAGRIAMKMESALRNELNLIIN